MNQLVGTWRLVSLEIRGDDGTVRYPLGRDVSGQLKFASSGHMSAIVMRQDRPMFNALQERTDASVVSDAAVRAAFEGYVAYCSTWDIDEERGIVTHHVTESLIPAEVGQDNVRKYTLTGDTLRLETVGDEGFHGVLIWERASSHDPSTVSASIGGET